MSSRLIQSLGLDVAHRTIQVLLLEKTGSNQIRPAKAYTLDLNKEGLFEEELFTEKGLPRWLQENKLPQVPAVFGISQEICTTQLIDFPPNVKQAQLEQMVSLEIGQLAGLSEEKFISDYQTMGAIPGYQNPTLIGICREQNILELLEQMEQSNLSPSDFAMNGMAMASAFHMCRPEIVRQEKLHLLLDFEEESTNAVLLHGGSVLTAGTLLFNPQRFLQENATQPEQPKPVIRLNFGKALEQGACPQLIREVNSFLKHWQENVNGTLATAEVAEIWICGREARHPVFRESLQAALKKEVNVFGPLLPGEQEPSPEFAVAFGLALQGMQEAAIHLSMAPQPLRWKRLRIARFPFLLGAAVLFFLLAFTTMGLVDWNLSQCKADLEEEILRLNNCVQLIPQLDQTKNKISAQQLQLIPFVEMGGRRLIFQNTIAQVQQALGTQNWCVYLADEFSVRELFPQVKNAQNPPVRQQPASLFGNNTPAEKNRDSTTAYIDVATMPLLRKMYLTGFTELTGNKRYEAILAIQNKLNGSQLFQSVDWQNDNDTDDNTLLRPWKAYFRKYAAWFPKEYADFSLTLPLTHPSVKPPPPARLKKRKRK